MGKAIVAAATVAVALAVLSHAGTALGQEFPTRPIRIVAGTAAGGGTDIQARLMAEHMSRIVGQPVVVENRGGGGGAVAVTQLLGAPADGYTIVVTQSSVLSVTPLSEKVQYKLDDFAVLALTAKRSTGLLAKADAPFKGWKEFEAWARAKGAVSYAASSISHGMIMERIGKEWGVKFNRAAARGGSEALTMLLGGHVDVGFNGSSTFKQTLPGRPLQLLAVVTPERNPDFPAAPTLLELGHKYWVQDHLIYLAPARTPRPILQRLSKAILEASAVEMVRSHVDDGLGQTPVAFALDEARGVIAKEISTFKESFGQ
jgi:tripartite-type tricarboxylate transporter receptor subunit TctC